MDYDNTNRGALFRNDKKVTENHPDYTGKVNVAGKDLWLSAWVKTSKNGKKYMSLSITDPAEREFDQRPANEQNDEPLPTLPVDGEPINLDDIPF
jgi:uncharacterized protein (DUF736 family)